MARVLESNEFQREVLDYKGVVLVDFYADWCGPCKMIAPVLDKLDAEMRGKAKILKVNVDQSGEISGRYGVMSIPTLIVFKDGKAVDKVVGVQSIDNLRSKIAKQL